jgi:uncharacterized membrane protein YozB (DUF420 family)
MSTAANPVTRDLPAPVRGRAWTLEHSFYLSFATLIAVAVFLGFARTFFLRNWFPSWAARHAAPEFFFIIHGLINTAWFALFIAQIVLVGSRRVRLHRQMGWFGSGVAIAVVILGVWGSLIAARRPTGFIDVPLPPLQFLAIPLSLLLLFSIFVTLAILRRRDAQTHKRCMVLASLSLIEAAVGRWPLPFLREANLLPFLSPLDLTVDLFLLPLIWWDLNSRKKLHPVTLWGGLALILSHPLRLLIAGTGAWQRFASWTVHLLGP